MRPLTPFASYHDNAGLLLVGRVRFCNLDSSPAEVFAEDGTTSLGSSVFTDSSGRLVHQPFLDDHDYLIYFDKYVGHATMTEDDDPESWEEQGSAIDRYNTIGIETDGETVTPIATIDALRHTDPETVSEFDGVRVANLLGYYVVGDKPSIYYVWNPTLADADDGGSVIKVADIATGRWVLKECPVRLDVRHFGAFPERSDSAHLTQRYSIQKADAYAHSYQCGLYFYADAFSVFYDITGLTIHDVDCNHAARLYSTDTKAYIVGIEKVYLGGTSTGYVELVAPTVRTSWANGYVWVVFNPSERLVVDAAIPAGVPHHFSDIIVEMNVYCGQNVSFDNCEMVSRGAITGQMVLENMAVKTEWFPDDYDWANLAMTDCSVILRNCKDATTYVILKNKISEADYGDLGEQTVTGATLLAGCVAENAYFVNVTIQGSAELHNVTGTVIADPENPLELTAIDCWLTFLNNSDFGMYGLSFYRGALTASVNILVTDQLARADSPLIVLLKDVELNSRIRVDYAQLNLERCVVKQPIIHSGLVRIRENIVGNKFENASLTITELGEGNGKIFASWKNNECTTVIAPIIIDRSKISQMESDHSYIYAGNSGTFPPIAVNKIVTLTVTENVDIAASFDNTVLRASSPAPNRLRFFCRGSGRGLDPVNLFRIGTDPFSVHVRWAPVPMPGYNDLSLSVVPNEFLMKAEYVPGSYFSFKPNVFPPENGALNSVAIIGEYVGTEVQLSGSFRANMTVSTT